MIEMWMMVTQLIFTSFAGPHNSDSLCFDFSSLSVCYNNLTLCCGTAPDLHNLQKPSTFHMCGLSLPLIFVLQIAPDPLARENKYTVCYRAMNEKYLWGYRWAGTQHLPQFCVGDCCRQLHLSAPSQRIKYASFAEIIVCIPYEPKYQTHFSRRESFPRLLWMTKTYSSIDP